MREKLSFIYRAWKQRFRYDPDEINYIAAHVKKGDVVIDLGAHKGVFLYWLRKFVGRAGQVYGFEPQPSLATYLKKMVTQLKYNNTTIEWMGVSSRQGEMDLIVPEPEGKISQGASFEMSKKDATAYHTIKVQVDTLDNYFNDPAKKPVKFIKCDVEGHELEVFRGGINLLKKDMPTLLFECEARHMKNGSVFDVFSFLKDLGYKGYFFLKGKVTPLAQFDLEVHQKNVESEKMDRRIYCNNFVFVKEQL